MSLSIVRVPKTEVQGTSDHGACLSKWRLWQLATNPPDLLDPGILQHLDACSACSRTLGEELSRARAFEASQLPRALERRLERHPTGPGRRAVWSYMAALGAACAATAAVLLAPSHRDSGIRVKGTMAVHVSVMRGDNIVAHDVAWADAPKLQDGDRLRVRILTPLPWVGVWAQESKRWSALYVGGTQPDGWLPVGFRYDAGHVTQLRAVSCPQAPSEALPESLGDTPTGCQRLDLSL